MLEREIKLSFDSPEQARAAVIAARATLVRPRRLQHDVLFDTADQQLRQRGCALRIRFEDGAGVLTFKGPVMPGSMKLREEHESRVDDPAALRRVLEGLGYRAWFTYEKFREEYALPEVIAAINRLVRTLQTTHSHSGRRCWAPARYKVFQNRNPGPRSRTPSAIA